MCLEADAAFGQGHQESEILERGRWSQLRESEKLYSVEDLAAPAITRSAAARSTGTPQAKMGATKQSSASCAD